MGDVSKGQADLKPGTHPHTLPPHPPSARAVAAFLTPAHCLQEPWSGPPKEGNILLTVCLVLACTVGDLTNFSPKWVMLPVPPHTPPCPDRKLQPREDQGLAQGGTDQGHHSWDSDLGPQAPTNLHTLRVTVGSLHPLPLRSEKDPWGLLTAPGGRTCLAGTDASGPHGCH